METRHAPRWAILGMIGGGVAVCSFLGGRWAGRDEVAGRLATMESRLADLEARWLENPADPGGAAARGGVRDEVARLGDAQRALSARLDEQERLLEGADPKRGAIAVGLVEEKVREILQQEDEARLKKAAERRAMEHRVKVEMLVDRYAQALGWTAGQAEGVRQSYLAVGERIRAAEMRLKLSGDPPDPEIEMEIRGLEQEREAAIAQVLGEDGYRALREVQHQDEWAHARRRVDVEGSERVAEIAVRVGLTEEEAAVLRDTFRQGLQEMVDLKFTGGPDHRMTETEIEQAEGLERRMKHSVEQVLGNERFLDLRRMHEEEARMWAELKGRARAAMDPVEGQAGFR